MTVEQRLKSALEPVGLPVELDLYTGPGKSYITFNSTILPMQFCDDGPMFGRALIQVHLICPLNIDFTPYRDKILTALAAAGFTPPEIIPASDAEARHIVFETEAITEWRKLNEHDPQ